MKMNIQILTFLTLKQWLRDQRLHRITSEGRHSSYKEESVGFALDGP